MVGNSATRLACEFQRTELALRPPQCYVEMWSWKYRRLAITNHRLLAFEHDQVTFRWKDYAHGNKKRIMTLSSQEFLRRFLLHVLPRGFVRIRSFGFLANRRRVSLLPPLSAPARRLSHGAHPRSRHFFPHSAHLFPLPKMFHSHAYRRKIRCHYCLATLDQDRVP